MANMTSMANSGPASSLELLLVERAKALQQANPALKAFADMQGMGYLIYIKEKHRESEIYIFLSQKLNT